MKSPPKIESQQPSLSEEPTGKLNSDIPATAEDDTESVKSEVNEKLTEEITDRILAQLLQEELREGELKLVFNRQAPRVAPLDKSKLSPGGSRVRNEPMLEVAVTSDRDFNINQSISVDQIIAGVDTSLEAVD